MANGVKDFYDFVQVLVENQKQRAFNAREYSRHDWGKPTKVDTGPINEIRAKRAVKKWQDFNPYAFLMYGQIASRFPGFQVFACGSQVRGDYVLASNHLESIEINHARKLAGMRVTAGSDFDFWVEKNAESKGWQMVNMVGGRDRCRLRIPEHEKIALPMWDFSKLPETEHQRVIDLFNVGNWRELMKIHDQYELSPYSYCCDETGLKNWFEYGIESGQIKTQQPETEMA